MKTFVLGLFVLLIGVFADANNPPIRVLGSLYTQNINPRGSFYDIDGLLGAPAEAATRVNFSSLPDPVRPGSILIISRLGGISYNYPTVPDDSADHAAGVFINSDGGYIFPIRPGTTAPSNPFLNYCDSPTPIGRAEDFSFGHAPPEGYDLIVPTGALAMLVAPPDCPVHDNADPNGNYKVSLRKVLFEYTFTQVSRYNYDYNSDGVVELIAGEHAQLTIDIGPNVDVTNSEIHWDGVPLPVTKDVSNTGLNRNVNFNLGQIFENPTGIVPVRILLKDVLNQMILDETVNVFVMPLRQEIYQVVKNPDIKDQLEGTIGDGIVDLVAGKNADVVLELKPNFDITKSEIFFEGPSATSTPYKLIGEGVINTDDEGKITFKIDTVPYSNSFVGINSMVIEIKDSANNRIMSKKIPVHIRKTKPIRIGFIPITGCFVKNLCFSATSFFNANWLASIGGLFVNAQFPVADIDFSTSYITAESPLASGYTGDVGVFKDFGKMEQINNAKLLDESLTHVIGVVTKSYFSYLGGSYAGVSGIAHLFPEDFENFSKWQSLGGIPAIVTYDYYATLAHEMGHLMALHHEPKFSEGYLNYDLNSNWLLPRGPMTDKISLMSGGPVFFPGTTQNFWIEKNDYLAVFKRNLVVSREERKKTAFSGIKIFGGFMGNGNFKVTNTYMIENITILEDVEGEYLAQVKDINDNIIFSKRLDALPLSKGLGKTLNFELPMALNAMFVHIYKINPGSNSLISQVVIPSELLEDMVSNIPNENIIGNAKEIRDQLIKEIQVFRTAILEKKVELAKNILNSKIAPIINQKVQRNMSRSFGINADKEILNSLVLNAFMRVRAAQGETSESANSLVRIQPLNNPISSERSKIEITFLKKPKNTDYEFYAKALFNGTENIIKQEGSSLYSESPRITTGIHQWNLQVYLRHSETHRIYKKSIEHYLKNKVQLEQEFKKETDPDRKYSIILKIQKVEEKIYNLENKLDDGLINTGNSVEQSIEVL